MDIDLTDVSALPANEQAAPAPEAAPEDTGGEIPDEILQIPAFEGLLQGRPAAVYDYKGSGTPVMEAIPKYAQQLADAGIAFYKSKDGALAVMFNTQFVSPEDIEKADAEGKLTEVAEPLAAVTGAYDAVLNEDAAAAPSPAAPAPTSVTPAPVENKLTTARLANVQSGAPTSGPKPGAGRVLNNVLKRAV